MKFDTWEPVYERILADFGFDRTADERARDVLAAVVAEGGQEFDCSRLDTFSGQTVAVAGAGPSLSREDQLETAADADRVIAASTAADVLDEHGVAVALMVTDLDKNPARARDLTHAGTPVAAHAHGDNIAAVREHVPDFDHSHTLATTQAAPVHGVDNFGGFTDGDRAAFLADAAGAGDVVFVGWDFEDPDVGAMKAKKLRWAERLLLWLETRRGERFDLLDGRRETIERVWE